MNERDSRVLLICVSIVAAILIYTTTAFYIVKENQKEKMGGLQKTVDEITSAKQGLETRVREIELQNAEMKSAISAKDDKIEMISKYLEETKALNNKAGSRLQEKDFEIRGYKAKLEEEKAEKEDLIKRYDKLHENYLNIRFQLTSLIKTKEEMEARAKSLAEKEGVSLGTVVIKQTAAR